MLGTFQNAIEGLTGIGVRMLVRQGDPPTYQEELVHGELSQHIADLIARIKMGGGAGVKSELNFCLYCHTRLSSISVATGFVREGTLLIIIFAAPKGTWYSQISTSVTESKSSTMPIGGSLCLHKKNARHSLT